MAELHSARSRSAAQASRLCGGARVRASTERSFQSRRDIVPSAPRSLSEARSTGSSSTGSRSARPSSASPKAPIDERSSASIRNWSAFAPCRSAPIRAGAISTRIARHAPRATVRGSPTCRLGSTADWPLWPWSERLARSEQDDQDDDQEDQAADTDIHGFTPIFRRLKRQRSGREFGCPIRFDLPCRSRAPALLQR